MSHRSERLRKFLETDDALRFFRAPGRVNLMGDHTDYNDGFVLPAAIDRDTLVAVVPRDDQRVVVRSLDLQGMAIVAADGSVDPALVEPPWARLVAALVTQLAERGRPPVGAELAVTSDVPRGSGLSSSAAFEVAVALALCHAADFSLAPVDLALAGQAAEHAAFGVPSGLMDQLASVFGVAGHALLIDCADHSMAPVRIADDLDLIVVHSGVARDLSDTPYRERREACEAAAARLGLPSLRRATLDQVADDPVARHVVTENERVDATARALVADDRNALARLLSESHASLRDDFGASAPELDHLVEALTRAGAIGARLTGAGWGGCVVAVCARESTREVLEAVTDHEAWTCRPVDGAGPWPT